MGEKLDSTQKALIVAESLLATFCDLNDRPALHGHAHIAIDGLRDASEIHGRNLEIIEELSGALLQKDQEIGKLYDEIEALEKRLRAIETEKLFGSANFVGRTEKLIEVEKNAD